MDPTKRFTSEAAMADPYFQVMMRRRERIFNLICEENGAK
jgi:hypothetical protein